MTEKDCFFHFKIHNFASKLMAKKNPWFVGLGGMILNFNTAIVYAKVMQTGNAFNNKQTKRRK